MTEHYACWVLTEARTVSSTPTPALTKTAKHGGRVVGQRQCPWPITHVLMSVRGRTCPHPSEKSNS